MYNITYSLLFYFGDYKNYLECRPILWLWKCPSTMSSDVKIKKISWITELDNFVNILTVCLESKYYSVKTWIVCITINNLRSIEDIIIINVYYINLLGNNIVLW